MARLRNIWACAVVTAASLGVGISLLLGGALGTTVATGASPHATAAATGPTASQIFGCRASLAQVTLAGTVLAEPAVANPGTGATTGCNSDTQGVTNSSQLGSSTFSLGSVGPANVSTYQVGSLGGATPPGAISQAAVTGLTLTIGGYTLSVAGPMQSYAAVDCMGTSVATQGGSGPEGSSSSEVLEISGPTGTQDIPLGTTVNSLVGSLPAALSALISITANEQIVTPTSLTENLFDIKLLSAADGGAQIVIGQATVGYTANSCSGNVPTTTTVTTTTPGTVTTIPGTTTTVTGTDGTATTVTSAPTTITQPGTATTVTTGGGGTTIIEPTGGVPGYLQECADGSTLDPASGDCVIVYDGTTIYVSKPFKGPVGGTVIPLPVAQSEYHSSCLSGPGPDFVFVVSKSGIQAKGTPVSDRILITGNTDHVAGLAGDDCIDGMGANERITDGNGKDRIYYHKGYNIIVAGNGSNLVRGEGATRAYIIDGTGSDYIYAGSLRTVIQAYGDAKHIFGGAGNDRIWTNSEVAKINCGGGKANVVFARKKVAAYAAKHGCQRIGLLH